MGYCVTLPSRACAKINLPARSAAKWRRPYHRGHQVKRKSDDLALAETALTRPGRVFYPKQGITKRALAQYYERSAYQSLAPLQGRPRTLVRCPDAYDRSSYSPC